MDIRTLTLILSAAAIGAGCASKETKPEPAPPPPVVAEAPPAKPTCPPPTTAKVKSTKKKGKKQEAAAPVDCEPAKPKTINSNSKAAPATAPVAAAPATTPPPAPAKEAEKPTEPGKPRMMKSTDGTFEGEVYGNIPPNSKWAKLKIGMHQSEVERIVGVTSNIRGYVTGKAFIPFYFGTDSHRYEAVYAGQGSVAYTGGGMGGGQGTLMMINYDPKIQ